MKKYTEEEKAESTQRTLQEMRGSNCTKLFLTEEEKAKEAQRLN